MYSGINIDVHVGLRIDRVSDAKWERPWFEMATEVTTIDAEDRLEAANFGVKFAAFPQSALR